MTSGAGRLVRRLVRGAGAVGLVTAVLVLLGAPPALAADESIGSYDTRVDVHADGGLAVTETIGYDFGDNQRHGIYRKIPARFRYDATRDRVYPIDAIHAFMDGQNVKMIHWIENDYVMIQIGDPDRTITGPHTYTIAYTVRAALNGFPDHQELFWNLVGAEWQVPIGAVTATVDAPAPIQRVTCFAGPTGSRDPCTGHSESAGTAVFRQSSLRPGTGLTAVLAFPPGTVATTAPILVARHDPAAAFRATPATVGGAAGLALIGVAVALALAYLRGRDRHYVGQLPGLLPGYGEPVTERRKPLTGQPPVSVEFVPPYGIRPAQADVLIRERARNLDLTATIVDLAVRGHLHIAEVGGNATHRHGSGGRKGGGYRVRDWELTRHGDGGPDLLPYERTLFEALFSDGDQMRLSRLGGSFARVARDVRDELERDLVDQGWYRRSPRATRGLARTGGILLVLAGAAVLFLLAKWTQVALIGVGTVLGAVAVLAVSGRLASRTGRGSAVLARVEGFRLYVATAEAAQLRFQEREQIFSAYLPYAIVFGLTERWTQAFAQLGVQGATGTGLTWYTPMPGTDWTTGGGFHQTVGAFTTATATASTPVSASGGSGFSSDGGGVGGGGGGGGGGSW
jgi:hypothetical protein